MTRGEIRRSMFQNETSTKKIALVNKRRVKVISARMLPGSGWTIGDHNDHASNLGDRYAQCMACILSNGGLLRYGPGWVASNANYPCRKYFFFNYIKGD